MGNFKYCLKEKNTLFIGLYGLYQYNSANRDCSEKCYGYDVFSSKICIDDCISYNLYEYENICYDKCPKRTKVYNNTLCEPFNCTNYYNYEQSDCINEIPEGFYLNDSYLKTINKCPNKCKACNNESAIYGLCISPEVSASKSEYQKVLGDSLVSFFAAFISFG